MSLSQFYVILLARKSIILFILFVTIASAVILTLMLPKTYTANTTLIINYKNTDPITGAGLPAQMMPGYTANQLGIIASRNVALKVVKELELDKQQVIIESFYESTNGQGEIQRWVADSLLRKLSVTPESDSSLVDIQYEGTSPQFVASIANAFAKAYIQTNLELKVAPAEQTALWYSQQLEKLRANFVEAQRKLSQYQIDKGIVSLDRRLDIENARLAQLSEQLVVAESQAFDSASRNKQAVNAKNIHQNVDIINNPLIQNMKADLAVAEANLAEVKQRYQSNHPAYQAAVAEVDKLKSELNSEIWRASGSLTSAANISQQYVDDIAAALKAQKERILQLNQQRDEMDILQRDVENAQKFLDMAMSRFTESTMEGQTDQTDVVVLNPATVPIEPSSPNLVVNILLAIFMGTFISVVAALGAETFDRRIRSVEDVTSTLGIPVLADLHHKVNKRRFKKFSTN